MDANQFTLIQKKLGLTDIQLAKALGVTRFTIFRWRKGSRRIPEWVKVHPIIESHKKHNLFYSYIR